MGKAVIKVVDVPGLFLVGATKKTRSSFISVPSVPERRSRRRFCSTFGDHKW
ncbi:hypothetical protein LQ318_09205 [Aliifodinibius salicampi]|uniref:Uncharacterized protein n=1 Tax=Fodinibius salicampi TaxID=1920655 RepID=A0ABT3PZ25_9BACT|nr:hypothetical protein [Fodinibius salicampi]MCW9713079.1 hypothetical protein [Fodinibius salicampi]